jgi:hypothetical protein
MYVDIILQLMITDVLVKSEFEVCGCKIWLNG